MELRAHLEKLVIFESVCRLKGFSTAAKELKRSQPAISRSIKELEDVVGARLLKRWNRGIELSEVGQKLLTISQIILKTAREFEIEFNEKTQLQEIIFIGTKEPIAVHIWAEFVAWCRRTPGQQDVFEILKRVELVIDKSNRKLIETFNARDVDILLIPPDDGISLSAVTMKLLDTHWSIYVAKDHSDPIESTPLILYEQTLVGEKTRLQDVLDLKTYPAPVLKVNSLGTALALSIRNLGATILPTWMAAQSMRQGELRLFQDKKEFQGKLPQRSKIIATYWKENANKHRALAVSKIAKSIQLFCRTNFPDA